MKALIRLDMSNAIGTGHWRRMTNLIQALRPAEATFAVRTDNPGNALFQGSEVHFLASGDEVEALGELCDRKSADLLITDLLAYPEGYLKALKRRVGAKVVSFHEYQHVGGGADLSVNCNTFDGYETAGNASFLAGPQYIMLSPELLGVKRSGKGDGVLVTFGGSDPSDFSKTFLEKVVPSCPEVPFLIHGGPFFRKKDETMGSGFPNVRWTTPKDSFFKSLAACRMLVTAGGNTMYEAMFLGMVPLVVAHNTHQAEFASNVARLGACSYFGRHPDINWEGLAKSLLAHYDQPESAPCRLVDGEGTHRLVDKINRLFS